MLHARLQSGITVDLNNHHQFKVGTQDVSLFQYLTKCDRKGHNVPFCSRVKVFKNCEKTVSVEHYDATVKWTFDL